MKKLTFKQKNRIFNTTLFVIALALFVFCLLSLVGCRPNGNTCPIGEREHDTIIQRGTIRRIETICVPKTSDDDPEMVVMGTEIYFI